ncbi:MAG TPA: SLBB domain-containing protein [Rhizomicrobium sp.]|jgi:protein involved in polysaccharide export with SLBB domain
MSHNRRRLAAWLFFLASVASVSVVDEVSGAKAQTPSPPPDVSSILQSLGQSIPSASTTQSAQQQIPQQPQSSNSQTFNPALPSTVNLTPSRLELLYSQRAGQPLTQFGYDTFGSGQSVVSTQLGGVQDNYILGPGDQVSVVDRGHDNSAYTVTVDRDGRLIVPNIDPVAAAGRTFGEVRAEIEQRVARAQFGTKAYVSLASSRQISVVVSGEVNIPGVRTLSGLNSPIDALLLSGGVRKTGSLRNIIVEHAGTRRILDLYGFLGGGRTRPVFALGDGDRIIVPALQDTVAVIGLVKRPGIYELPPGARAMDARSLMRIAGGIEIAGVTRLTRIGLTVAGRTELSPLTDNGTIKSGEILSVDQRQTSMTGRVTLVGDVQLPGTRPLTEASSLSRLIRDGSDLADDAYTLFGLVMHRDPRTKFRTATAFSLQQVFEGKKDLILSDNDVVMVFSTAQIQLMASTAASTEVAASSMLQSAPPSPATGTSGSIQTLTSNSTSPAPTSTSQSQSLAGVPGVATAASAQQLGVQQSLSQLASGVPQPAQPPAPGQPGAQTQPGMQPQTGGQPVPQGASTLTGQPLNTTPAIDPRTLAAISQASPASAALLLAQSQNGSGYTGGLTTSTAFGNTATSLSVDTIAAQLGLTTQALLNIAASYLVWVQGQVADPGAYLADSGTSLKAMLDAAGGTQLQSDLSSVEVTSTLINPETGVSSTSRDVYQNRANGFQQVMLRPLDSIRVRQVFTDRDYGTVSILGQVKFPGVFNINRGEKLSSVLLRAGGITNEGYPYGAVFLRQSAAQQESVSYAREASELESSIGVAASDPTVNSAALGYLETLATNLRNQKPIGRITAVLDPVVLVAKPELDMLLEPGDQIFIPKRPSTVAVSGEVLNAGAFQYKRALDADDYIQLAGGETQAADDSSTFVIYPDGSAHPLGGSWFSFGDSSKAIPPGSTIVVPHDPTPFNAMVFFTSLSDIVSKLAITAASLAVLGTNN